VGNAPTFESWEPVWVRYGSIVADLTAAAYPRESTENLRTHIVDRVADAFVRELSFDPLESMVVAVLDGADATTRNKAIEALTHQRLVPRRVESIVTAIHGSAWPPDTGCDLTTLPHPGVVPTFDEIRAVARSKWRAGSPSDPRSTPPPPTLPSATGTKAVTSASSNRRRLALVAGILAVLVVAGVAGIRYRQRPNASAPALLYVENLGGWSVIDAGAYHPRAPHTSSALAQTFVSFDGARRVSLLFEPNVSIKGDNGLGAFDPPLLKGATLSQVRAYSDPCCTNSVSAYWIEQHGMITLRSDSMTSTETERFIRTLTAGDELGTDGYTTSDRGFRESHRIVHPTARNETSSSIMLQKSSDPALLVFISVRAVEPRSSPEISMLVEQPPTTQVRLSSGRNLRTYSNSQPLIVGTWTDRAESFDVIAGPSSSMGAEPNLQGQQSYPGFFPDHAMTAKERADVLALLARVRVGTVDEWRTLTNGLQAKMRATPAERTLHVGDVALTLRTVPDSVENPGYLCNETVCTRIYFQFVTEAADLIINGHWWHFEKLGSAETPATWRTSPPAEPAAGAWPTAEDSTTWNRWVGVDFGTKTLMARRGQENDLINRPYPDPLPTGAVPTKAVPAGTDRHSGPTRSVI
jgi:hypothetical protein